MCPTALIIIFINLTNFVDWYYIVFHIRNLIDHKNIILSSFILSLCFINIVQSHISVLYTHDFHHYLKIEIGLIFIYQILQILYIYSDITDSLIFCFIFGYVKLLYLFTEIYRNYPDVTKIHPTQLYTQVTQIPENTDCSICLVQMQENIVQLECQHYFHQQCIDKWFKQKSICPLCRSIV